MRHGAAVWGFALDVVLLSDRLRTVAGSVLEEFEDRNGYPPGENEVAVGGDGTAVLTQEFGRRVPADVAEFFAAVDSVSLSDLWNGYVIGPATWSVSVHRAREPRTVHWNGVDHEVIVVASNGGGALYAIPLPDGPVLILPPAGIEDGVYRTDFPLDQAAPTFGRFVEHLADAALAGEPDPFDPYRVLR